MAVVLIARRKSSRDNQISQSAARQTAIFTVPRWAAPFKFSDRRPSFIAAKYRPAVPAGVHSVLARKDVANRLHTEPERLGYL
jgi:hypothetical protein